MHVQQEQKEQVHIKLQKQLDVEIVWQGIIVAHQEVHHVQNVNQVPIVHVKCVHHVLLVQKITMQLDMVIHLVQHVVLASIAIQVHHIVLKIKSIKDNDYSLSFLLNKI